MKFEVQARMQGRLREAQAKSQAAQEGQEELLQFVEYGTVAALSWRSFRNTEVEK